MIVGNGSHVSNTITEMFKEYDHCYMIEQKSMGGCILVSKEFDFTIGPRKTYGGDMSFLLFMEDHETLRDILPDLNTRTPIYLDKEKIKLLYDIFVRSELL